MHEDNTPQQLERTEVITRDAAWEEAFLAQLTHDLADSVALANRGMGSLALSLFTFDRDVAASGKSVCNGPCATNWPPLMGGAGDQPAGDWTIVVRDDGSRQWAWRGKPVYYWVRDAKPGDRTGDGFNNAWRLARP